MVSWPHKLISWVTHFAMITSTKENSESDADSLPPGTKTAVFKQDYMFAKAADIDCCGRGIFHETKLYIRCASEHQASVEAANHCSSCRGCVHLAESICNIRAIAAGPVSLVSTGPLFPIALPISAIARRTPKQDPKYISDMLKLAKWPLFTV